MGHVKISHALCCKGNIVNETIEREVKAPKKGVLMAVLVFDKEHVGDEDNDKLHAYCMFIKDLTHP